MLTKLRNHYRANNAQIFVGVITNSDDRVPDVLSSLGLRVSPLRHDSDPSESHAFVQDCDIDFCIMSYDVGYEKPDKRMFAAAEEMLDITLRADIESYQPQSWQKVYVGDEYDKDVVGATNAGWNAVLINEENASQNQDVRWLDDQSSGDLQAAFKESSAVGFRSLVKFSEWLPEHASR